MCSLHSVLLKAQQFDAMASLALIQQRLNSAGARRRKVKDTNKAQRTANPIPSSPARRSDVKENEPQPVPLTPGMLQAVLRRESSLMGNIESKTSRVESLERVYELLCGEESKLLSDQDMCGGFEVIFKGLLKRFGDDSERCRELAVQLVMKYLSICSDVDYVLPYLFPALMERCSHSFEIDFNTNEFFRADTSEHEDKLRGRAVPLPHAGHVYRHIVMEPSEEVRELHCKLLSTLLDAVIRKEAYAVLGPYFHDTILFLHASAVDPYPTLRVAALRELARLAASDKFANTMHHYCPALIKAIMPSLRHKHSKARKACVEAVEALVACPNRSKCKGGGSDAIVDLVGYREENVLPLCAFYSGETRINYFGNLVADKSPSVRLAFYGMLAKWMTSLLDRWDHSGRLLPFLLTGLIDETEEIQNLTLETLDELGQQYEEEHADEVVEKKQLGVDGAQATANYEKPLPAPWKERPRIGTRLYVRSNARNFIFTVLRELGDWRQEAKRGAVKLFKVCLVYLEEHITMEAHKIVKALLNAFRDEELKHDIVEAAELAGRFVEPQTYLHLLLPIVSGDTIEESVSWEKRSNALSVLGCLMEGTRAQTLLPYTRRLLEVLTQQELVCFAALNQRLSIALIQALTCFLSKAAIKGRPAFDAIFIAERNVESIEISLHRLYTTLLLLGVDQEHASYEHLACLFFDTAHNHGSIVTRLHAEVFQDMLLKEKDNDLLTINAIKRCTEVYPMFYEFLSANEQCLNSYVSLCLRKADLQQGIDWEIAATLLHAPLQSQRPNEASPLLPLRVNELKDLSAEQLWTLLR